MLPESLRRDNRSAFSWRRANPVGSIHMLARSRTMVALSGVLLLGYVAQNSLLNVYVLYSQYRYHWSERTVGVSLAALGLITIVYGFFLVRRASARIGDRRAMIYGLFGGSVGYLFFAFSPFGWLFLLGMPILNLTSIAWPAAQGMMSRAAEANEQGQLQGAINSLRGIAGMIGPGLFTLLFANAVGAWKSLHLPGLPYLTAAVLMLCSVALAAATNRGPQPAMRPLVSR